MIKEYLLEIYIYYLENIFSTLNKKKKEETWNKIKNNTKLLEYVSIVENNSFKSNKIVSKILQDKTMYNKDIYKKIIETIYSNKEIAKVKLNDSSTTTFLLLTLKNEELVLTKEQKLLLILEAENSPFTEKYYKEKLNNTTSMHGTGLNDLRYQILCNNNFTNQEKINLFNMFYPDDEIKLTILKELEWSILYSLKSTSLKGTYEEIYELDYNELEEKIIEKIELCKKIKELIPETTIKKYYINE